MKEQIITTSAKHLLGSARETVMGNRKAARYARALDRNATPASIEHIVKRFEETPTREAVKARVGIRSATTQFDAEIDSIITKFKTSRAKPKKASKAVA